MTIHEIATIMQSYVDASKQGLDLHEASREVLVSACLHWLKARTMKRGQILFALLLMPGNVKEGLLTGNYPLQIRAESRRLPPFIYRLAI